MTDLLAHALVGFVLGRLLGTRYDWVTPSYVTAVMAGAFVPDLVKAKLLVRGATVEAALGIPFDWMPLKAPVGAAVAVLVGAVLVVPRVRVRAGACLALGAVSHLLVDALLLTPSGRGSVPMLWPLSRYHPPTPGLYLSTQAWPTAAALVLAAAVFLLTDPNRPGEDGG
jgi:membrane-bound metal-dependent hydrolase YbcI (DUF457 family)